MERAKKIKKILAMFLTVVMMTQNIQVTIAGTTTEELDARTSGKTVTQSQPSQDQLDERTSSGQYQKEESQENGENVTDFLSDGIYETENDTEDTAAAVPAENVSAAVTQQIFQQEYSGVLCNFVQMTAEVTNNDTEKAAEGVNIKVLLPATVLSYVNEIGSETAGIEAYAASSAAEAGYLGEVSQDVLNAYADGQSIMWRNQTIGAGQTTAYTFTAQLQDGITDVSGINTAWYVNGSACSYKWVDAEILVPTPEPTEEPVEEPAEEPTAEPTPEVTEEPAQEPSEEPETEPTETPAPEVTEEPEAEPTETPAPEEETASAKQKEMKRLMKQRSLEEEPEVEDGDVPEAREGEESAKPIIMDGNQVDLQFYINDVPVTITEDLVLNRDDKIDLVLSYQYSENNKPTQGDNVRYYDLPGENWVYLNSTTGNITNKTGKWAGTYEIKNNRVYFYYDSEFLEKYPNNIKGDFTLFLNVDKGATADDDEITVDFPGMGGGITIRLNHSDLNGKKDYLKDDDGNPILDTNGYLTYKIELEPATGNVSDVTVQDTISDNLGFVPDSFIAVIGDVTVSDLDVTINGQTATISLGEIPYGQKCVITYKAKIKDGTTDFNVSNTATWKWDGDENGKSDSAPNIDIKNKIVKKDGAVVADKNQIDYTIVVNELKENLIIGENDSEKITLTDVIDPQVTLLLDSIKILDESNHPLSNCPYNYNSKTRTLTIEIPDETYAKVLYSVRVNGNIGDKITVNNAVDITGTGIRSEAKPEEVTIQRSTATVTGDNGTITLIKVGQYAVDGNQPYLSGVKFSLYEINIDSESVDLDGELFEECTTDGNGELVFGQGSKGLLQKDTLYYFKETETFYPYILDSTKVYFVLDATDEFKQKISEKCPSIAGNVNYYVDGEVLPPISNDTIPTPVKATFEIAKNLDDGIVNDSSDFGFRMKLSDSDGYRPREGGYVPIAGEPALVYDKEVHSILNGKITFPEIEFRYEGTYCFEVTEIAGNKDYFYDSTKYIVSYRIERNGAGNLEVKSKSIKKNGNEVNGVIFNNYTATKLNLKKTTNVPVKSATTFTFYLTGTWKKSPLDFSNVKINGEKIVITSKGAQVNITVPKDKTEASVELSGLPKGAEITVSEADEMPNGWSFGNITPENGIITLNNTNNEVTVLNNYGEKGEVTFRVIKEYNDWRNNGKSFTFNIEALPNLNGVTGTLPLDSGGNTVTSVTIPGTEGSEAQRTADFGKVKYTENGDYYYKITEQLPEEANGANPYQGTTYDSKVTYIKIKVEDGQSGTGAKKITRGYAVVTNTVQDYLGLGYTTFSDNTGIAKASFENRYNAQISVQFSGTKKIENAELGNKTFYFYITGHNINEHDENYVSGKGYKVSNAPNGIITFPVITYTQNDLVNAESGEFVYTLTEETANMPSGITADTASYSVKVTVTKNADGSLSTSVSGKGANEADYKSATLENNIYKLPNPSGKAATFVNTYGASTQVVFAANKSLSGKALTGNDFDFVITGKNGTVYNNSAKNTPDGNITFPEISYTVNDLKDENGIRVSPKVFNYEIKEDITGITPDSDGKYVKDGITYDTTTYNVSVTVTDGGNGELSKVVKVDDTEISLQDGKYWIPVSGKKTKNFENRYDAQTSIQFRGIKVLENKNLENEEFSFILTRTNASGESLTGADAYSETVKNDSQGQFEFTSINYSLRNLEKDDTSGNYTEKTYYYTIKEDTSGVDENNRKAGITYDTDTYLVTVVVSNAGDGTLSKTVTVDKGTISNGGNGDVYTLTNSNKNNGSTTTSPTFKNEYGATTEVKLAGTKVLENKQLTNGAFTFSLKGSDTDLTATNEGRTFKFAPISYDLTMLDKNTDGNYGSKTFTYIIKEECTDPSRIVNGVTYDAKEYSVSVTVTNVGNGELSTLVKVKETAEEDSQYRVISKNDDGYYYLTDANTASFTNTYNASTKIQLTGTKQLIKNNDAKETMALQPGDFSFIITGPNLKDGENTVESVKVSNKAAGRIDFPEITYQVTDIVNTDEDGNYTNKTFTYTIAEDMIGTTVIDGKHVKNGITYDPVTYTVDVTVTNNLETGTLSKLVELVNGETRTTLTDSDNDGVYQLPESDGGNNLPADKIATFTNMYNATGSYAIPVVKEIVGRKFKSSDSSKFKFYVTKNGKEFDDYTMVLSAEDEDKNTKQFTFREDTYNLNDVGKSYLYTVWEGHAKEDQIPGITTSEMVYQVRVSIADKGDGTLVLTKVNEKNNGELGTAFNEATFQNIYEADGTAQLSAVKNLAPLAIEDDQFSFTLTRTNENGDPLTEEDKAYSDTVTNKGTSVVFKPLVYDEGDVGQTFWYSVREEVPKIPENGYTYSRDAYRVKIDVTAAEGSDNKLTVTKTFYKNTATEPVPGIVFDNSYEAKGSIDLVGKKELTNGTLEEGKFNFIITENGNKVAEGTNDADGNIQFSTIKYVYDGTHNPLGEHTYEIREVQPAEGDKYIYDTTVRKVVVNVTDNETGELTAEIVTDKSDVIEVTGEQAADGDSDQSDVKRYVVDSFVNREIEVYFKKTDVAGNDLEGAELTLYEEKDGKKDKEVAKWTTDGKDHTVTGLVAGKTYILEETKVPEGYVKASPITFKIHNDTERKVEVISGGRKDDQGRIIMLDLKNGVQILKLDEEGKGLVGAELAVKDAAGNIVEKWTSTGAPHIIEGKLAAGKQYTLTEISAPKGYKLAKDIPFTFKDSEETITVTMKDAPTKASILKVDENGKGLAGAELAIKDSTGTVIEQWETNGAAHVIEAKLIDGAKYTLYETKAPAGYAIADPITFTMDSSKDVIEVQMKDIPYNVSISKTDLTGEKNISGATLQIRTKDGKVLEEWITDGKSHAVKTNLEADVTYILHEVSAPAGYRMAADIEFTVDKTGKATTVTMKDAPTRVEILKTDENDVGLSGAVLAVKDSSGKTIDQWTSDGKSHVIEGVLEIGKEYTLTEISAPSGYTLAQDMKFTVSKDEEVIKVSMKNYPASGSGKITVTKKVSLMKDMDIQELIAKDDTFYVNLFTDAEGKYPYKGASPKAIHLVNASSGTVTFDDLAKGTYYVYETDAYGNVMNLNEILKHNGQDFMCMVEDGSNSVELNLKAGNKEGYVNLNNVFYDLPDGYSYRGYIDISKKVLKGTSETTVDDTFYAGVFTRDADGVYNLVTVAVLEQNGTVTVEVPLGGENGDEPIKYYILETDAEGNIVDLDVFAYEVSGEGTVALDKDNLSGKISLVNKLPEEKEGKLFVKKVDGDGVGLAGADFRLTDEEGDVVDEWTSEASAYEISLEPGVYTLTEVKAPDGYTGEGEVKITVDEDYNISIKSSAECSIKGDVLKYVNRVVKTTPVPASGGSGGSGGPGGGSAGTLNTLSGKVAVKTGDDTPIGMYIAILLLAALAVTGTVVYTKKKKSK